MNVVKNKLIFKLKKNESEKALLSRRNENREIARKRKIKLIMSKIDFLF